MSLRLESFLSLCAAIVVAVSFATTSCAQAPVAPVTKHHKLLHADVGTWNVDCKMWISPEAEPVSFQGVEKNRLLEGGLWLVSEFTSQFGPQKYEGHGVFGYDTEKEKFVGIWIDSMQTSMSKSEGTYDPETKTMTMYSKAADPATGKMVDTKGVGKSIDDDHRHFEMFAKGADGKYWKTMEMKYTRAD